jgi:hypothetical protein
MAVCYSLWSFVTFFPIWYVWSRKNLATLVYPVVSRLTNSRTRMDKISVALQIRVARFKPNIQIWVNFGLSCNGRCWCMLCAIRSIFRPFGIFCGHLVLFPRFGMLYQEKSGNHWRIIASALGFVRNLNVSLSGVKFVK